MNKWKPIDTVPEGVVVATKIFKRGADHNVGQKMKRVNGRWFFPTGELCHTYRATHWMSVQEFEEL